MSQKRPLWDYFERLDNTKASCRLCGEEYKYNSTGNLRMHLRRKHFQAYINLKAQEQSKEQEVENETITDKEQVIYIVAENRNSTERESEPQPINKDTYSKVHSRQASRTNHVFKRNRGISREATDIHQKRLIEQLTKKKIEVATVQKELTEKELEEKTVKVLLLQEELAHRKHIYELEKEQMYHKKNIIEFEKQQMEHNKQMQELAKEEILLKIELLRNNLATETTQKVVTSLPTID